MRLVIEVVDLSLVYDRGEKVELYASFDVRGYWVINAWNREITVHRDPSIDRYTTATKHLHRSC